MDKRGWAIAVSVLVVALVWFALVGQHMCGKVC